MSRIYFSVDIETNGLAPGIHSMISIGVAAIDMETGDIVGTFKRNLQPIPELQICPDTMEWWKGFPDAYQRATENSEMPLVAVHDLYSWVKGFGIEHPVAAAWKPMFDLGFLRYYEVRYLGGIIFGRSGSGLDIKTVAALALEQSYGETQVAKVPKWMKEPYSSAHTHDSLQDAIEQAHILYNALRELDGDFDALRVKL